MMDERHAPLRKIVSRDYIGGQLTEEFECGHYNNGVKNYGFNRKGQRVKARRCPVCAEVSYEELVRIESLILDRSERELALNDGGA